MFPTEHQRAPSSEQIYVDLGLLVLIVSQYVEISGFDLHITTFNTDMLCI